MPILKKILMPSERKNRKLSCGDKEEVTWLVNNYGMSLVGAKAYVRTRFHKDLRLTNVT